MVIRNTSQKIESFIKGEGSESCPMIVAGLSTTRREGSLHDVLVWRGTSVVGVSWGGEWVSPKLKTKCWN
jgi:hypothetical protein